MVVTEMVVFMASPFERGSQPRKGGVVQDAKPDPASPSMSPGNGEVVKDHEATSSLRASQRASKRMDLSQHKCNGLVSAALFQRNRHKSVESLPTSDLSDSPRLVAPCTSVGSGLNRIESRKVSTKQVLPIILKKKIKIIRGRKGFRVVSGDKGRSSLSAQKRLSVSSAKDPHFGAIGLSPNSDLSTKLDPLTSQSNKLRYVPNHIREEGSERGSKLKQSTLVEETVIQSKGSELVGNIKKFPHSSERKSFKKEKKTVKFKLDEEESERLRDILDVRDEECVSGVRELMQFPRETAFQLVAVEKQPLVNRIADHVRTHLNLGDSVQNHLKDTTSRSHVKWPDDDASKHKLDLHSAKSNDVGYVVRSNSQRDAKDEKQPQRFVRSSASRQSIKEKSLMSPGLVRRNSSKSVKSSDLDSKLLVRRCVIGGAVTFGLVQVQPPIDASNGNGYADGHGLVTIRMTPDDLGRFGFNVKGGADQGMPIIVSRVAPGTPADLAIPRLNEGDQVLYINGRDVSQHTHEQVVMFIKASRETHSGELVLVVRPNVYVGEDQGEEPDLTYIPETHQIASSSSAANTLDSSLMLLQESLESGAALAQFEQLYRKKPGMSMNAARNDSNIPKNRYRDISPYDQTRVVLKTASAGDYINANYVNMEIPGSGIVNRYIAAQGPLPNTCTDFWQMVWEQQSSLVVMLTTKVERGRVKCHQYWPELYETEDFGALQITCVKEEETPSFAFREFNLTHVETSEERHIRHMQYIAWPDHGVPDDPSDFLEFVMKVRQSRSGMVEPTIVHCSAGIGRTGVLITMESAMCLIEARQPVYPLSIVRQMRDQRAMLIQTSSQYKFVCEAILRVYNEGLVKPMEDYHR